MKYACTFCAGLLVRVNIFANIVCWCDLWPTRFSIMVLYNLHMPCCSNSTIKRTQRPFPSHGFLSCCVCWALVFIQILGVNCSWQDVFCLSFFFFLAQKQQICSSWNTNNSAHWQIPCKSCHYETEMLSCRSNGKTRLFLAWHGINQQDGLSCKGFDFL